jgi:uncharacterized damage-inducible protein DinB
MTDLARMVDSLHRNIHGDAWHGPALLELIEGVTTAQATAKPIPGSHSIWEIVLHLTAWATEVERRLRENPRQLPPERDWPTVDDNAPGAWPDAQKALIDSHERLRDSLKLFSAARLDVPVHAAGESMVPYSAMLHGVSQHIAYHGGQIALLKNAQGPTDPDGPGQSGAPATVSSISHRCRSSPPTEST